MSYAIPVMILGGPGDGQVRSVMSDDPQAPPDRIVMIEISAGLGLAGAPPGGLGWAGFLGIEVTYVRQPRSTGDDGPRWYYVRRKPSEVIP